jgi:hypothetical protein
MPITYRYDPPTDVVRVAAAGDVTGAEIRDYFQAVVREPWWRPGMCFLADNRGVTTMPSQADLQSGAIALVRSAAYAGNAPVAVMVATPLQYGVVRQFDSLSAPGGAEMEPVLPDSPHLARGLTRRSRCLHATTDLQGPRLSPVTQLPREVEYRVVEMVGPAPVVTPGGRSGAIIPLHAN